MARPTLPVGSYGNIQTWQRNGVWSARVRYRDSDGIVRLVKRSGKSEAAAKRALKAALVERQAPAGSAEVTPDPKIAKVAELWFAEIESMVDGGDRSPGTLDTYRSIYRRHVEPAVGALRVRELTTPVADRVVGEVKAKSPSRARTAKVVLSGIAGLAARHGAVTYNPVRLVRRIDGTPKRPPRSLSATERQEWIAALEESEKARAWDLPDLSRMMLATGCRVGEALAFGWSEIDLDAAEADIAWRLVRRTGVGLLRLPSTKTGEKGERLVPLPSWAVTMLRRRRAVIGDDVEAVFPDSLGGWRDPSNVRRVWREVRDELELEDLVTHTLRKTVASFLDDAGVVTRKVSDQLGHARVSMTQDHYIGRRLTDRETADVLEGMFEGESGPKAVPDLGRAAREKGSQPG